MFTESIAFKHWVFEIPVKLNRKIYSNTLCGYSEFHVKDFRTFFRYSDEIFTDELKDLLSRFGIDYKKETLVKKVELPKVKHAFMITYQFLGSIRNEAGSGTEEPVLTTELEFEKISDSTSIAFYQVEEKLIGKHIIYAEILFQAK